MQAARALLARVQPEIRARALELLVIRKRLTVKELREVLGAYLGPPGPVPLDDLDLPRDGLSG